MPHSLTKNARTATHTVLPASSGPRKVFDAAGFYSAIDRSRRARNVTWKDVSRETGVSQTTLTRMASDRRPDAASLAALSAWAGVNPANYVSGMPTTRPSTVRTLDQVSLLLRQDALLTDEARTKLESIVEVAYNALKTDAPPADRPPAAEEDK